MKTTKELAKEYADRCQFLSDFPHDWNSDQSGYVAGATEAMRWIDPNIELPDYYKKVIVKYERDDSKIDYACVSRLADDDGAYFFGDYRFDIVIDFDKVIGWRPIE